MQGTSAENHRRVLDEIARFKRTHAQNFDEALLAKYGNDFDAELWGHTAASFLQLVESLLVPAEIERVT